MTSKECRAIRKLCIPSYHNTNMVLKKLRRLWYTPKKEVLKDKLPISPKRTCKVLTAV